MTEPSPVSVKKRKPTAQFKKDYKRIAKRGYDLDLLEEVADMLCAGQELPEKYYSHPLTGQWKNHLECHIAPDWLLIYMPYPDHVRFVRTGTHSDLF